MYTVGIVFLLLFKQFERLRLNNLTSKQIELSMLRDTQIAYLIVIIIKNYRSYIKIFIKI